MPRYYFDVAECSECSDRKPQPCFVFTADCGGDEISLCRECFEDAGIAFVLHDFGDEPEPGGQERQ